MINVGKNIKQIVSNVNNVIPVFFMEGNKKEIEAVIQSKDDAEIKFNKYPAIVLERPFDCKPSSEWNDLDEVLVDNMRLLFVTDAELEERNDKRFSTKFEPILYPLFEEYLNQLNVAGYSYTVKMWSEHPYYGTNQKVNNDRWEVLEVIIETNVKNKCNH